MLECLKLACARGHRLLFADLNFSVAPGSALCVQGRNGAGKTSLLRLLSGLSRPERGEVRWRGRPIQSERGAFQRQLCFIGHQDGIKDELNGWENLCLGLPGQGAVDRAHAHRLLADAQLDHLAELPARVLSQGQRRRIALARLDSAAAHSLWLLDEPLTALDSQAAGQLHQKLIGHLAAGGTLVYTTHQPLDLPGTALLSLDAHAAA